MNVDMLKQVQDIQLKALILVDEICKGNKLQYYLSGGTLLGAVRHKGFIPWDDDLDIMMPRNDYEKLLSIFKSRQYKDYFLQEYRTDSHYIQPYAKLRVNDTVFKERSASSVAMNHGVYIDIFPLDKIAYPNSVGAKIRRLISRFIVHVIWSKEGVTVKRKSWRKIEKIGCLLFRFIPKQILVLLLSKVIVRDKPGWNYFADMLSSNYGIAKTFCHLNDLGTDEVLLFNCMEFKAPINWHAILTRLYGEYLVLPKVEDRKSNHDLSEVSLGRDADCYDEQI